MCYRHFHFHFRFCSRYYYYSVFNLKIQFNFVLVGIQLKFNRHRIVRSYHIGSIQEDNISVLLTIVLREKERMKEVDLYTGIGVFR